MTDANSRVVARPGRREQLVEVVVFLLLIVPSLVLSLFSVGSGSASFVLTAVAIIVRDLGLVALILYFLWRNREPVEAIGWTARNAWKEALLGAALFVPMFFGVGLLDGALRQAGLSAPQRPLPSFLEASGMVELVVAVVLVVVVAVAEETIFRGYLLLRLAALPASRGATALLSAVIFSLGHGYEGAAGVVTVAVMGLIFALVYQVRGSLIAPIFMHFLQDFIGIVLLPLSQ